MGWGSGPWGSCFWGSCTPAGITVDLAITEVDVVAADMLIIYFNKDAKNNAALANPGNYSVVPVAGGQPVNVLSVQTGNEIRTRYITLHITPFTVGEDYTVTAVNLKAADGTDITPGGSVSEFTGRQTKTDLAIAYRGNILSRDPNSIIRNILTAISLEDDRIGGSRR